MKRASSFLIVTVCILIAPLGILRAQGPAIALQNVCWTTPAAIDSNIVAYWLISSRDTEPKLINYLDAQGNTVVTSSGGTFQNGFCCCTGSGANGYRTVASKTDSLLGLTTFTVGFIDTVGLDIASLTQSAPKGDGYLVFYDELTNRNYKILLSTLMPEPYPGYTSCECDTIYQAAHGFAVGDIVGQVRGNGPFFEASTGNPDSLPVAYIHEVLHTDTFVIKSEGWLMNWTHGLPLGRDYFVQDTPGTLDTIPDSTYSAFAFRTVNTTKAYFDIPELVVDQSPGSGSGGTTGDADWYKVGTSSPPTAIGDSIYTNGFIGVGVPVPTQSIHTSGRLLFENYLLNTIASNDFGLDLAVRNLADTDYQRIFNLARDGGGDYYANMTAPTGGLRLFERNNIIFHNPEGQIIWRNNGGGAALVSWIEQNTSDQIRVFGDKGIILDGAGLTGGLLLSIPNMPNYASDAAADGDGTLCSGCVYTVTSEDRTIRIKP